MKFIAFIDKADDDMKMELRDVMEKELRVILDALLLMYRDLDVDKDDRQVAYEIMRDIYFGTRGRE